MINLKQGSLPISLLALALSLSACHDESTSQTQATQKQTLAQTLEAEDQQAALYDQADSLWYLENERAKRLASSESAQDTLIPSTPLPKREVGDYSFTSPPVPPVSKPGQLLNLPDPGNTARFTVKGLQWPTNVGDLSISMWPKIKSPLLV